MNLDSLRINQLSPAAFAWYQGYLAAMDSGDIPGILTHLAPECAFQINNHLPMHGHEAIIAAFERYWAAIESIEHDLLNIYGDDHRFCAEMLVHYTRKDGSIVTLPAAVFIDRNAEGHIVWARSYVDAMPVHDAFTRKYA